MWYSEEGEKWTCATDKAPWPGRSFFGAAAFDNKIWVLGGNTASGKCNDAWYSTDGKNWTSATGSAGWSKRGFHEAFVYDNELWVSGGEDATNNLNDLWHSKDGKTWTKAPNAPWQKRRAFPSAIFDNKLWIIGGMDGKNCLNDIWYCDAPTTGIDPDGGRTTSLHSVDLRVTRPTHRGGAVTIGYTIRRPAAARISVFDCSGRELRTLVNEVKNAGSYTIEWNGCASDGNPVAAGAYVIRMNTGAGSAIREIIKGE